MLLLGLLLRLYRRRQLKRQPCVYLELTPHSLGDKKPEATEALFAVLHTLGNQRSWLARLLEPGFVFSLEIVSTRAEGIRYIVRLPEGSEAIFRHSLQAYLPEARIKTVSDELSERIDPRRARVTIYRQKEHFAYPLKRHDSLDVSDPLSYLTGAMTKLQDDELIVFQIVLSAARVRGLSSMTNKIMSNGDLLASLSSNRTPVGGWLVRMINSLLFGLTDLVTSTYHGASKESYRSSQQDAHSKYQAMMGLKPARMLTSFEQELVESINHKLSQSLFRADIRTLVLSGSKRERAGRSEGITGALATFSTPKYQAWQVRPASLLSTRKRRLGSFSHRLPALFERNMSLLSVTEVADLYHFPNAETNKTENIIKSLSRTLPAPVSLKNATPLDVLLGENIYHGSTTPIGLTAAERERHLYIIGGTGNGKTTMLLYSIIQDIKNGKGLAVIDPHGDLAETILRHIPEERIGDVIYLNPDDLSRPIGLNLLELAPGLTGDDLLREKDLITESIISVFRKIFSDDDSGGHRIEYILRNTIQTALTIDGATLFTIFHLLNDKKFRRNAVKTLRDRDLINFWNNEIGKAGDFQRVKMTAGITAKVGRFLFSASAKRTLEQPRSTIDFDEILGSGKILICNFSKGLLGEDTSTLFGTTILAKLQMAALRRARLQQSSRRPFYLYVDEFQNFATMSFVQMLSEARKYKLFLTMAEQSTSQQEQQRMVDIILANVGTVICFRSGSPADERFVLPLFSPYIQSGEIANLPAYNYYARIAALDAQEPMSGRTVLLEGDGSKETAKSVVVASRMNYAKEYRETVARANEAQSNVKLDGQSTKKEQPNKGGGMKKPQRANSN
jgi:hypothetical protein